MNRFGPKELGERPWLVMGGGGLKGLAHVGAWRAFEELDVTPFGVVGTSIGAFLACALASGASRSDLEELAHTLSPSDIVRVNRRVAWINGFKQQSVLRGDVLSEFYERTLPKTSWADMKMPVQVNAVSLATGESVWFGPGARVDVSVLDAVRASSALPILFPPVPLGDDYFVDGGAVDMLGLDRAADLGATGVIAIDAGSGGEEDPADVVARGLVGIQQRLFSIMSSQRRLEKLREWDRLPLIVVRPELDGYGVFDFDSVDYFLAEGYRATLAAVDRAGAPR